MYTASYGELYGLEWTILRFGIPYGPRARPTAVVPAFTAKALAGAAARRSPATARSRGASSTSRTWPRASSQRSPRGARTASTTSSGDENTSVRAIARAVRDIVGDVPIVHVEGRAGDLHGGNISGERAASELGWEPRTAVRRRCAPLRRVGDRRSRARRVPATASSTDGSAAASCARSPASCRRPSRAAARRRPGRGRASPAARSTTAVARAPSRGPSVDQRSGRQPRARTCASAPELKTPYGGR